MRLPRNEECFIGDIGKRYGMTECDDPRFGHGEIKGTIYEQPPGIERGGTVYIDTGDCDRFEELLNVSEEDIEWSDERQAWVFK